MTAPGGGAINAGAGQRLRGPAAAGAPLLLNECWGGTENGAQAGTWGGGRAQELGGGTGDRRPGRAAGTREEPART